MSFKDIQLGCFLYSFAWGCVEDLSASSSLAIIFDLCLPSCSESQNHSLIDHELPKSRYLENIYGTKFY